MTVSETSSETLPVLHPRFRLLRRVGEGGMGVVYEAFDERRQIKVALKTLKKLSAENTLSLKREFRSVAQIRHPNLIRYFDLVATFGQGNSSEAPQENCFVTMELLEGKEFLHFLQHAALTNQYTEYFFSTLAQLSAALEVLHQAGIIHRDLKPGNILISAGGQVKLLDFGIAQSMQVAIEDESTQLIEGTPHYMSPEQVRGKGVSTASDMYSFGVILYLLLTGRPPFAGKTTRQILLGHIQEPPPLPSKLNAGVAPELEALCLELLEKDPQRRPTAHEVLVRLQSMGAPDVFVERRPKRFVGREEELALLEKTSEEVLRGARKAILLGGESGVGKSALSAEALRRLTPFRWRILMGRCYEREQIVYNALDPLIDTLAVWLNSKQQQNAITLPANTEYLAAMFPVLRGLSSLPARDESLSPHEVKRRALLALRDLFKEYGGSRAVLACIDDLQWADSESLSLLEGLLEGNGGFFLLGTFRSNEVPASHPLQKFWNHPNVQTIQLPRFGEKEVRQLLGDDATPEQVSQVVQETQGNAFLTAELAFYGVKGGAAALSRLFAQRQTTLSLEARKALAAIVISGSATPFGQLSEVTRLAPPALALALDDLVGSRWIKEAEGEQEDSYDTYHDRIREVLYREAVPALREKMHLRFVESLKQRDEPEQVATHLLAAGSSEAAPWLLRAAQKAQRQFALERASRLYLRALEAGGESWAEARHVREARAEMLEHAGGMYQEAAAAYREAARYETGMQAVKLSVKAAEADLRRGDVSGALEAAKQAMAPYETLSFPKGIVGCLAESGWRTVEVEWRLRSLQRPPGRSPSERNVLRHLLYQRIGTGLAYFDLYLSGVFGNRALSLALEAGTNEQVVDALSLYALFLAYRRGRSNLRRAKELYEKSVRWREPGHDVEMSLWHEGMGAAIETCSGDFALANTHTEAFLEKYRAHGFLDTAEIALAHAYLAINDASGPNPTEHLPMLKAFYARALSTNNVVSLRVIVPQMTLNCIVRGELSEARKIAATMPKVSGYTSALEAIMATREAMIFLAEGAPLYASSIVEKLLAHPLKSCFLVYVEQRFQAQCVLASAYLAQAKAAKSKSAREALLVQARKNARAVATSDDPVYEGVGMRLWALCEFLAGDKKKALSLLNRAVDSLSLKGEAYELAMALLARGVISGSSQDVIRGNQTILRGGFLAPSRREGLLW